MKNVFVFLAGAILALVCVWLVQMNPASHKNTFSSFDPPRGAAAALQFDTGRLKLHDADLDQLLNLYQEVSARTVIRGTNLPAVKISLQNPRPLNRVETLQLLDTTLAQNGVMMILSGEASVKAVSTAQGIRESPPSFRARSDELPDSCSYMTCTVPLKKSDPNQIVNGLTLMSRMPNAVVYVPSSHLLILRDYSANIRIMLRTLEELDRVPIYWVEGMGATNANKKKP